MQRESFRDICSSEDLFSELQMKRGGVLVTIKNEVLVMNSKKRPRVLYADDDEDACLMLGALLGFWEIDVSAAHTVKEAFQMAQNGVFDLYLLDGRFPDGDGFGLCRSLRRFAPQTPIIFYSGDAYERDKQKGFAAGADQYLVKPHSDAVAPAIFQLVR